MKKNDFINGIENNSFSNFLINNKKFLFNFEYDKIMDFCDSKIHIIEDKITYFEYVSNEGFLDENLFNIINLKIKGLQKILNSREEKDYFNISSTKIYEFQEVNPIDLVNFLNSITKKIESIPEKILYYINAIESFNLIINSLTVLSERLNLTYNYELVKIKKLTNKNSKELKKIPNDCLDFNLDLQFILFNIEGTDIIIETVSKYRNIYKNIFAIKKVIEYLEVTLDLQKQSIIPSYNTVKKSKAEINSSNNNKVQWRGNDTDIYYLLNELEKEGYLTSIDKNNFIKIVESFFLDKNGKPFKDKNIIQGINNLLTNEDDKSRNAHKIDKVIKKIKNPKT